MGLSTKDIYNAHPIYARLGTPGGATYHLKSPTGPTKCMAPLKNIGKRDQYCAYEAGYGTDHPNSGRCKWHSGNAGTKPTNGRYSIMANTRLRDTYEAYLNDPDMGSLIPELALLRTILHQHMDEAKLEINRDKLKPATIKQMLNLTEAIGRTVERIDKAQSRHVLTVAAIRMIMIRAMDTAGEFVDPARLAEFIDAWEGDVLNLTADPADIVLLEG